MNLTYCDECKSPILLNDLEILWAAINNKPILCDLCKEKISKSREVEHES